MKPILFIIILGFAFSFSSVAQINYQVKDKKILEHIFSQLKNEKNKSTAELMVMIGTQLKQTPYVAHTLETDKEVLLVNLRELDCTTFAENCLAIARTIRTGKPNFNCFTNELTKIRYRNGEIKDYPSRLHYFSDWIYENDKAGLVKSVSQKIANIPYPLEINFMSTHASSYKALKDNPEFVPILNQKEKEISAREMYFLPKEKIKTFESKLREGDIVGITTSISGLDITHVGIIVKVNGQTHLMHASSKAEKVIISEKTLNDYLKNRKSVTGIMIARPI